MKTKLTEAQIERAAIEQVFVLTGGELESKPTSFPDAFDFHDGYGRAYTLDKGAGLSTGYAFKYWYTGVPEWAAYKDYRTDAGDSDYFTVLDLTCSYGSDTPGVLVATDGSVWARVAVYTRSGESECPYADGSGNTVNRAEAALELKYRMPVSRRAYCPFCEERIGSKHGTIYMGDCAEVVYKRMVSPYIVVDERTGARENDANIYLSSAACANGVRRELVKADYLDEKQIVDIVFSNNSWLVDDLEGKPLFTIDLNY